ncbi:hypothetical protein [Dyadobacter luticola]|uniref:Uncharacterized protein n=1 Tax=Dyadobacter luticola TaxID=1979387 RepID=A0A5R9KYS5_9BACT|nr:hypothetical protein [Dyadobacter luticola]TLV01433.1 hypothetical protein FEN17_18565 [Dyadobacter luticola]
MSSQLLRRASIWYLCLPNLLFFFYWTSGFVRISGLVLCLFILYTISKDQRFSDEKVFTWRDMLVIGGFSLILTCVSGISGLCYQTFDYWCHNTKFYELFKYDWPIRIPDDGPVIAYYYGFYLVPALYSKMIGSISEGAIFLWSYLGLLLGVSWLYLSLHRSIFFVFIVLGVGDLPHVLKSIFFKLFGYLYEFGDFGVEAWSNFENLLWVPNQVIPTLIIGGMLFHTLKKRIDLETMVLPVALSFWWAVFPAFTSGLLIGILIVVQWLRNNETFNLRRVVLDVMLPCLCCLPILILYLSHEKAPISGFLWQFPDHMPSRVLEYFINIGLNILVFYLAFRFIKGSGTSRIPALPFFLILLFITVFPIYRIGKVNDFLFRGLMPLLIVAGLYLYEGISDQNGLNAFFQRAKKAPLLFILALLLASSSLITVGRIVRAASVNVATHRIAPDQVSFQPIPYDAYPNIYEVLKAKWSQMEADQYLGKKDSLYELFIAPAKD